MRGLASKWKFPVYLDYDFAPEKSDLEEIIIEVETTKALVFTCTSDQGPRNISLANELGISPTKIYFQHPNDPDRIIFWIWDFPHVYKSGRNNLLDHSWKLPSGSTVQKSDLKKVIQKSNTEISIGYRLNDDLLQESIL